MRILFILLMLASGLARADIILLLSDDKAPVAGVARAIQSAHHGKIEVHNLNGTRNQESDIVQSIRDSHKRHVIAVGLLAAQVARQKLASKQVVFCQVLNVEEFDLVTPWMKGVSGIPSLSRQFSAWKMLDPSLRKVGIITGRNARYMVDEAEAAAKHNGLELEHIEVASDRAVLFAAQDLRDRKIQGLWLAPDSSILSQRVILDLMSFSVKNHLQVLAFSPALLKEGALLSATSDAEEIARLVLERVRKSSGTQSIPGEAVASLGTAKIVVSGATATRFGLTVSTKLREQADVQ